MAQYSTTKFISVFKMLVRLFHALLGSDGNVLPCVIWFRFIFGGTWTPILCSIKALIGLDS
jgi:hypothetical protein